jgi:hypothetical protein
MRPVIVRAALAGILLSTMVAPATRAECPSSDINGSLTALPADSIAVGGNAGAYDLRSGDLYAHAGGGLGHRSSELWASDVYRVEGLPPGTPVDVTAELQVWAMAQNTSSHAAAWVWDITSGAAHQGGSGASLFALPPQTTRLTIHTLSGQAFPVTWHFLAMESVDGCLATMWGQFRFVTLPAGGYVQSCQGYLDLTVPVRDRSWGELKAAYR